MNEEEVKIGVILPYLQEGGVEVQDLRFESSFSIRLGRTVHEIGGKRRRETVGGRLDVLVQRDGANLLVVEVKREELALTESDREQAISYARLVHPIAPYALVTNGRAFKLYDTITKAAVDLADARFDGLAVSLPDEQYLEAQRTFFRLDAGNLVSFCRQESSHALEMVSGTREDGKKYVSELHVRRESLRQATTAFLSSDATVLILSSTSGSGKTCELAALAEERLEGEAPTLFFNGGTLESTLSGALLDAFQWHFDSDLNAAGVLRRIHSLLGPGEPLLIVVDAIDEWSEATRSAHLSSVALRLRGLNIKLIASCRSGALETFTSHRDDTTFIGRAATIVDVPPFSPKEFYAAVNNYERAYDVDVWFEAEALELARQSPFFLRILFETAAPGTRSRLTTDSVSVFEKYLAKVTRKTGDPQRAIDTLREVGRVLYASNRDEVPESDLTTALGLTTNDRLMDALFEQNILVRATMGVGEANISFYFQQLRNYVIAFKALRFDQRGEEEMADRIRSVDFSSMQGEVHRFYYRLASERVKPLYDGRHRARAERYLEAYASLIEQHAPFLRAELSAGGASDVGLSAEIILPDRRLGFFGLRSVEEGDPRIKFYPVAEISIDSPTYLQGVKTPRFSLTGTPFVAHADLPTLVLDTEIIPAVEKATEQGRLDESGCLPMLAEQVLGAVLEERRTFAELRDGRRELPDRIRLEDVSRCLLKRKLEHRYKDERVQQKIESGEILVNWTGTGASYSCSLSDLDRGVIDDRVKDALDRGGIRSTDMQSHVDLDRLDEVVSLAVTRLQELGVSEVSASNWKFLEGTYGPENGECRRRIGAHVESIHLDSLSCYTRVREANFPLHAGVNALDQRLLPSAFFVLPTAIDPATRILDVEVMIYFVESDSEGPQATTVDESSVVFDHRSWAFAVRGTSHRLISAGRSRVRDSLRHRGRIRGKFFFDMPIRTYVYSRLAQELEGFKEHVLAATGE